MNLYELSIGEAQNLLKKKEISSKELTKAVLDRIESLEDKIGAYITVTRDTAIKDAENSDERILKGDISPLTGIPLSIKDLICTKGIKTTCASKILESFVPPYDATVMGKLKQQGAVIVGKTNMDEFAMGSSTEHSYFKTTHNPWDKTRIPGGSSGGSAASVAANMCLGSLGSDTGGSIRQPASHCGVVGLKPTYGRVSRFGLVAFASSLDQIGPITKNVYDTAILMNAISGYDSNDSTSVPKDVPDYTLSCKQEGLKGIVVGIPKEYQSIEGIDKDVYSNIQKAIKKIENLGATLREVALPHTSYAVAVYYIIAPAEASSNLARYDGVKYGYRDFDKTTLMEMYKSTRDKGLGAEVKRRIIIGTYALSSGYYDAYYKKASQVRTLIVNDFKEAFKYCNVILSPVAPTPAFKIGEKIDDPLTMYLSDIFTLSANLSGIPAISVPCGFSSQNLPIGLQIMGNYFDEETILKVAYNFEKC
ncbi:MAG: Asp-tRNA(Asn)/Glu-tRNA(Gln) amidotransferase subunit GatA [Desulfobacterales bacterium]|nr:Asp-tRNA(Asn)/Glu-tRNA(Gln) amidotransferase subunit GatA [Desulfobacterales bacterium]MBF0396991.1 Asp-tRNA(Asn)/Glu-tRNA(Gln) amidotransferase subunit GatA [Desulfobacterales bacterium]